MADKMTLRPLKPHFFVAPKKYRTERPRYRVKASTRCAKCRITKANHVQVSISLMDDDDCGGQHG